MYNRAIKHIHRYGIRPVKKSVRESVRVVRFEARDFLDEMRFVDVHPFLRSATSPQEYFEIPEVYEQFRDYMYHDEKEFSNRGYNKKLFKGIVRRRIELLQILLEEKKLGSFREDVRYREWHTQVMSENNE